MNDQHIHTAQYNPIRTENQKTWNGINEKQNINEWDRVESLLRHRTLNRYAFFFLSFTAAASSSSFVYIISDEVTFTTYTHIGHLARY